MSTNPYKSQEENFEKFSFENLMRLERGTYQLMLTAFNELESANEIGKDSLSKEVTLDRNRTVWRYVGEELYNRIDKLISIQEILAIPVSSEFITTGQG